MIINNHPIKVYYRDIDQMGIVYYSRYLEYFEEARTELLNNIGLSITKVEDRGIELPVISCYCEYKESARFNQNLIIDTFIEVVPKAKLKIEYKVFSDESSKLLVSGYTVHAFIKSTGRPTKIPDFILKRIRDYF